MAKTPGRRTAASRTSKPVVRAKRQPVRYTPGLARKICRRLAAGELWSRIAGQDDLPTHTALYQWITKKPNFAQMVRQARDIAADVAADDVLATARAVTAATATADRVRISALQWSAAKAAPHRYGARAEAQAPPAPIPLTLRVRRFEKLIGEDGRPFLREILPEGEK